MKDIKVIAHRGASIAEPENSLAAFSKALDMGAHMIEMDVRSTVDGQAIIMHDEDVDRTTNGSGRILGMSLDRLRALKLRNGQQVPTLEEVLEMLKGQCLVNLELKDAESAVAAGVLVKGKDMWKDVIFSSFRGPWLLALKVKHPSARVAFISDDRRMDCVRIAKSLKAEAINLSYLITTRKLILRAHEEGLDVNVWVVNSAFRMRKSMDMGADGIMTDKPDVLIKVLGERDDCRLNLRG